MLRVQGGYNRGKGLARAERCEEPAKVDDKITDYGVRITAQATSGRDAVAPLPASEAHEAARLARSANPTSIQLGQHVVLSLPEARLRMGADILFDYQIGTL